MYMAHTNWLPREGSSLVFSHPCDPATAATQDLEISPSVGTDFDSISGWFDWISGWF